MSRKNDLLMWGALCILILLGSKLNAQVITLAYIDKENFPYQIRNGIEVPQVDPGVTVELLQKVEKSIPEVTFRFRRMPWARCLRALELGMIDGLFEASYKPSREKIGQYPKVNGEIDDSKSILVGRYSLYKKAYTPISWDGAAFHDFSGKVGAVREYSIISMLTDHELSVEQVNSDKQLLEILDKDRVIAAATMENAADFIINNMEDASMIEKLSTPLEEKPYYLIFSHQFYKKNPKISEKIWEQLKEMRDSVEYEALLAHYYQTFS